MNGFEKKRREMVREIRDGYGLDSPEVLESMVNVPRHEFAPKKFRSMAYSDSPINIGYEQTMSQPYTVAVMSSLLINTKRLKNKNNRKSVLEIGTGSGYQAAVLSNLYDKVYSLEIVPQLAKKALKVLNELHFDNVNVRSASGESGWTEKAPFDAIIITAGVEKVPKSLFDQLRKEGVLIAPVGRGYDKIMTRYTKKSGSGLNFKKEEFGIYHFVPYVTCID